MSDHGSITLWTLGLAVMVLFLGGISLDLWRAFEVRQDLAAMADSAANAGASRIDGEVYRDTGVLLIDEDAAREAVNANLDSQQDRDRIIRLEGPEIEGAVVRVTLHGEVEFTLLSVFLSGAGPVDVRATGAAVAISGP
jgi:hypothetical protein